MRRDYSTLLAVAGLLCLAVLPGALSCQNLHCGTNGALPETCTCLPDYRHLILEDDASCSATQSLLNAQPLRNYSVSESVTGILNLFLGHLSTFPGGLGDFCAGIATNLPAFKSNYGYSFKQIQLLYPMSGFGYSYLQALNLNFNCPVYRDRIDEAIKFLCDRQTVSCGDAPGFYLDILTYKIYDDVSPRNVPACGSLDSVDCIRAEYRPLYDCLQASASSLTTLFNVVMTNCLSSIAPATRAKLQPFVDTFNYPIDLLQNLGRAANAFMFYVARQEGIDHLCSENTLYTSYSYEPISVTGPRCSVDVANTCPDGGRRILDSIACDVQCIRCGNGVVDFGETCDAGALNGQCTSGCTNDCKPMTCPPPPVAPPVNPCGNGVIETGEQCDIGVLNGDCRYGCSATCTTVPKCINCAALSSIEVGCKPVDLYHKVLDILQTDPSGIPASCISTSHESFKPPGSFVDMSAGTALKPVLAQIPNYLLCDSPTQPNLFSIKLGIKGECSSQYYCPSSQQDIPITPIIRQTPPSITATPALVDNAIEPVCSQTSADTITIVGSDECDQAPAITYEQTLTNCVQNNCSLCGGTRTRTWTATNTCGRSTSIGHVTIVKNTDAPVLTSNTTPVVCLWPPNNRIYAISNVADALARIVAPWGCSPSSDAKPTISLVNGPCTIVTPPIDPVTHAYKRNLGRSDWDPLDNLSVGTSCVVSNGLIYVIASKSTTKGFARVYSVPVNVTSPCGVVNRTNIHITVPKCSSEDCYRTSCNNETLLFVNVTRVMTKPGNLSSSSYENATSDSDLELLSFITDMSTFDSQLVLGFGGSINSSSVGMNGKSRVVLGGISRLEVAKVLHNTIVGITVHPPISPVDGILIAIIVIGSLAILGVVLFLVHNNQYSKKARRNKKNYQKLKRDAFEDDNL